MPRTGECFRDACPARDVLNHVSNRWGGLMLGALIERDLRYSETSASSCETSPAAARPA
ncbi:MAG: hypothetical protein M3N49_15440 [Candidatus Eremiobacteraeota bacterium]|nr:hypothetical protein [Candidatus Eremiobacteraeota bacterium]